MQFVKVIFILLSLTISHLSHATAHEADYISINGKEYALNTNPLDEYLKSINWQRPKEAIIWSSNWRGYIAKWHIVEEQLFLQDVTIRVERDNETQQSKKSILADLFTADKPVLASWYSGVLIIPDGDLVEYVHMGYGSSYDCYQIVHIEQGKVTTHLKMTAEEFEQYKYDKFEEFSKTEEFIKTYDKLKKEQANMTHDDLIDFLRSFYAEIYLSR